MAWTLQDIQNQIANELDQSSTAPTVSGTDWNIRVNSINRALIDWTESYDWKALLKVHGGVISTATGNASYALPSDFKKLDGYPRITFDGTNTDEFSVWNPSKNSQLLDSDRYVNILGNDRDGKVMYIHAPTLSSGASVTFTYYSLPATLATTTHVVPVPDPSYLVQRSLYYLYKAREDGRFPEAKVEADKILARMIENENSLGLSDSERTIHNWQTQKYSFRLGRD